ncbi:MAG TPA: mechanosensitive ion channel domain-containing protein [Gemmatimonadaceae bacterium]|nr:mechanosensitive ion channel domain-containing protein [Gemmatimonadaceae bacterium]
MITKLLLTVGLVAAILIGAALIRGLAHMALQNKKRDRSRFWIAQATHLLTLAGLVIVVLAIWFSASSQLAMIGGWIAAGLAIALQRVVTAFAGYLIILRGNIFTVGDRIMIGGVRGDVIALGFMQTTVMEMSQAAGEKEDDPSMWVHGRQYSGRLVRITNDKIFDVPVYNYTRDFPFMWEEMAIPIAYSDDYRVVERILLETAHKHTASIMAEATRQLSDLRGKYFLSEDPSVEPRVFLRLTDNWQELSLRFVAYPRGVRVLKDAMSREILAAMQQAGIGVASGTYAIVQMPTLNVRQIT